jgi:hypothetical protein
MIQSSRIRPRTRQEQAIAHVDSAGSSSDRCKDAHRQVSAIPRYRKLEFNLGQRTFDDSAADTQLPEYLQNWRPQRAFSSISSTLFLEQPPVFRFSASRNTHPISGGVSRVNPDSVEDYRELRRQQFGIHRVPLPRSLALSKSVAKLNRISCNSEKNDYTNE